ncbi:MAG TPA: YkvA family protein [Bauldia sp.]|nr:YkvA family protein [Bauldia sp.]
MTEVKYGEILGPDDDGTRARRVRSKFWATLRRAARVIPFSEDLVAAYYCALDPQTPHRVRGILLAALAYFVLPFDAVPDILAGAGFADDVTILVAAISAVRAHIAPRHREAAREALADDEAAASGFKA